MQEEVVYALKSPFASEYVRVPLSQTLTVEQLQDVVRLASRVASEICGADAVPRTFESFPINRVGHAALMLISRTMPDDLSDGKEGRLLLSMLGAVVFLRQVLERVSTRARMKREEYVSSVVSFCSKTGPLFVEAVRMRLPALVKQSFESSSPNPEMSQRLSKLADIAYSTFDSLKDIFGDDGYELWSNDKGGKEEDKKEEETSTEAKNKKKRNPETPRKPKKATKKKEEENEKKKKEEEEEEKDSDSDEDFAITSSSDDDDDDSSDK